LYQTLGLDGIQNKFITASLKNIADMGSRVFPEFRTNAYKLKEPMTKLALVANRIKFFDEGVGFNMTMRDQTAGAETPRGETRGGVASKMTPGGAKRSGMDPLPPVTKKATATGIKKKPNRVQLAL
jgi:hypothetical protein